jgi:hypothetical protein
VFTIYPPAITSLDSFVLVTIWFYESTDDVNTVRILLCSFERPSLEVYYATTCGAVWSLRKVLADHVRLNDLRVNGIARDELVSLFEGKRKSESIYFGAVEGHIVIFAEALWTAADAAIRFEVRPNRWHFFAVNSIDGILCRINSASPEFYYW